MRYRVESFVIAWVDLLDAIVAIVLLGVYNPYLGFTLRAWLIEQEYKRKCVHNLNSNL